MSCLLTNQRSIELPYIFHEVIELVLEHFPPPQITPLHVVLFPMTEKMIILFQGFLTNSIPYSTDIFVKKIHVLSAFYACCIYSNVLHSSFITEENTMKPNQIAP